MKIVPVLASLACTAALTACSDSQTSSAPASSTVATATSLAAPTVTSTTAAPSTVTTTAAPAPAPASSAPADTATQPASGSLPVEPVGTAVTIAGEPATVCIMGDGFGTNVWAANTDTSCEFVNAVYGVLTDGLNATDDNLRAHLPGQISVTSPVTEQDYLLSCTQVDSRLIRCAGGQNAAVYIY
ncbi:hypothetical protein CDOO_12420 [Corynebacterium doosanense CAU 212 = DSM 45436]|uniref:Uncharacterized protein n=2 Tax=Corynebacterium TaxID=1716 RepID=A0A097IIL1_9CORY|nr:hypothetical protein CDOO_12420 [Corynebacterium doosanense CAU 212 = DSM 45436]